MPDDMSNGSKNDIVNLVTPSMLTGNKRRNERGSINDIPFILLFIVIKIIGRSKTKQTNSKLPPGPRKLPLIGNIHQLEALPHQSLAKLAQQYGPLMHMRLGEISCIVVSSQEMAKEVIYKNLV
ncbi:cytochrome P450 family 71 protein [Medicago truncatula]|uniref:Cytochrome P450 family 71 protein n=1 Tax=Medicago truncatula TaxID=3880 RepID=G7IUY4_MEDTR|nr:cytochrome P450 family 71 protein [Medicago truncatula]